MPAAAATALVPATVVAPSAPAAAAATARSRTDSLTTPSALASRANSASSKPDHQLAADHADGGGYGAAGPYDLLDLPGDPQVVGPGQAVRDDRALQRDHRPPSRSAAATSAPYLIIQQPYGPPHGQLTVAVRRMRLVATERMSMLRIWSSGRLVVADGSVTEPGPAVQVASSVVPPWRSVTTRT